MGLLMRQPRFKQWESLIQNRQSTRFEFRWRPVLFVPEPKEIQTELSPEQMSSNTASSESKSNRSLSLEPGSR